MSIAEDSRCKLKLSYVLPGDSLLKIIKKFAQETNASNLYTTHKHYFITYKDQSWLFVNGFNHLVHCGNNFQVFSDYIKIPLCDPICFQCQWIGSIFKPCDEHSYE